MKSLLKTASACGHRACSPGSAMKLLTTALCIAFFSLAACSGGDHAATGDDQNATSAATTSGAAIADLPTFPKLDLSIDREINLNRDFVMLESNGLIQFIGDPNSVKDEKTGVVGPENMVLTLSANGAASKTVSVELRDGKKQEDVVRELGAALKTAGFDSQIVFEGTFNQFGVDKRWKKLSVFASGRVARPVPGRNDLGRLDVVFKSVALQEKLGRDGSLNDGPTQVNEDGHEGPPHSEEFARLSPNLKNFIALGEDALTHHEAQTLGLGLGVIAEPGESGATFRSGDRVVIEIPNGAGVVTTRAIVMSAFENTGKADSLELLAVDPRSDKRPYTMFTDSQVKVTRLVAGAFVDGR
jgi:hypothetical protein